MQPVVQRCTVLRLSFKASICSAVQRVQLVVIGVAGGTAVQLVRLVRRCGVFGAAAHLAVQRHNS